ncbi:Transaldolase [Hypsizygus marmoreus]|uniref:Transaldolase n=1 Tax=Hypsizygus marmoreus TaxID=39966 RepID=A0A369J5Z7_HYPMA|nr:Transaldolase [Hypsizygus marmoreus]
MPSPIEKHPGTSKDTDATGLEKALRDGNTAIICDSLDFEALGVHDLDGTTLNPASILGAVGEEAVFYHVWAAVKQTIDERSIRRIPKGGLVKASLERLLFELGNIILDRVDGPHFSFVDPRRHSDSAGMVRNAKRLVSLFDEKEIHRGKVVISIPATEEGLKAAKELESQHGIHTNLYLVSGLLHAAACAEAGATTVTIPVGPLLDWYEGKRKTHFKDLHTHPGVETVQSTLAYFKLHGIKSKVIGSGFRTLSEIGTLAEFDAICISNHQADDLRRSQVSISITPDSSPARLRARQAQYPTAFLSSKPGFMNAMSAETRSMVIATLFVPLGEMKAHMDSLELVVGKEVVRQFEMQTLDLKTLYGISPVKSQKIKKTAGDIPARRVRAKRSLAEDLNLEQPGESIDEDEIF